MIESLAELAPWAGGFVIVVAFVTALVPSRRAVVVATGIASLAVAALLALSDARSVLPPLVWLGVVAGLLVVLGALLRCARGRGPQSEEGEWESWQQQ